MEILDSPQKMSHYLTDNALLEAHLTKFLALTTDTEREISEKNFWLFVETLSPKEQAEVKEAKKKITQRLYDRMGSIIVDLKKMAHQKELAAA
jgi:hypothetical protein